MSSTQRIGKAKDVKTTDNLCFVHALRACVKRKDLDEGSRLHDDVLRRGLLDNDTYLGNTLVNMYAKCGALNKASEVLAQLNTRNVVSWSALISGYAQQGQGEEALNCFERMRNEGLSPNAVTYTCTLKACAMIGAVDKGKKLHEEIVDRGLLAKDVVLGTALVDMYAKCGMLTKAQQVLDQLPLRDVVTWSALIAGYTEKGQGKEALNCFKKMQSEGLTPNQFTYSCVLKACSITKAVDKGTQVHDEIVSQGLLARSAVLGTALVDMYAKCGVLTKAQQVFNELPIRDAISWSALIAGYAQQEHYEETLICFELMWNEGLSPDAVTYAFVLKACGITGALNKAEQIHDEIVNQGLLEKNVVLGTALVDAYAKCGVLQKAQKVFDELPLRNLVSWSALISGYVKNGQGEEALTCFEQMQSEGLSSNSVTYISILKACCITRAIDKGKRIHDDIVSQGLLAKDVALGNALVDMYVKCDMLSKAQDVLDELPLRDAVSWSVLIVGYAEHGRVNKVLECLQRMQSDGVSPDAITYACILKACGIVGAMHMGKKIHDEIEGWGLLRKDVLIHNALADMYAKCGEPLRAQQVVETIPMWDVVTWSALIAGYVEKGQGDEAIHCFEQMRNEGLSPNTSTYISILRACGVTRSIDKGNQIHDDIIHLGLLGKDIALGNALVDMYAKCGDLVKAQQVFDGLCVRDVVSWSTLIAGYTNNGQGEEALTYFDQMQGEGLSPNVGTYACILKACGIAGALGKGKLIHDECVSEGLLEKDIVLGNALVNMYCKCGVLTRAHEVLDELPIRDVVSWSTLIAGYAEQGQVDESFKCFRRMQSEGLSPDAITYACILKACGIAGAFNRGKKIHDEIVEQRLLEKDVVLGTALVDMYAKCGDLTTAQQILDELCVRDVVTWSALIEGYAEQGLGQEALNCLETMQTEGLPANAITYACILKVCGISGAIDKGKQIHDEIVSQGLSGDTVTLGTAMINMYSKCGALAVAVQMLDELPLRDVVSWSALMSGYSKKGQGKEAIDCFQRMQDEGISPNATSFICLLDACSHVGLVDEGETYLEMMSKHYGITPGLDHHTCMVDLFGRAGHFEKAMSVIEMLPSMDHLPVWWALLGACKQWGNVQLGRLAFEHVGRLDECCAAACL